MTWLSSVTFALAASYSVYVAQRGYSQLTPARRRMLLGLRLAVLGLVLVGLHGPEASRAAPPKICHVFVMDASASIAPAAQSELREVVQRLIQSRGPEDRAAIVVFGRDLRTTAAAPDSGRIADLAALAGQIDPMETDLAQALRAAGAQLADGYQNRVTLLSDGWATLGDAREEASRLAPMARVDAIVVEHPENAAQIVDLAVPAALKVGQPAEVAVRLAARSSISGELRLLVDDKLVEKKPVQLPEQGTASFEPVFYEEGMHQVRVELAIAGAAPRPDHAASALVDVQGRPEVLLVDPRPGELSSARAALESAGMRVTVADKRGFAAARSKLAAYDSIVLSEICAEDLGKEGAAAIKAYVLEGGGLIMSGGPGSFGAGGYYKTEVEEALPVYMDPYRQPVVNAVVLIVDKSWSMGDMAGVSANKIDLVKEAAIAAIQSLKDTDYLAILSFDSGPHIIRPMGKIAGDKQAAIDAVATMGSFGLTDWYPAMSIAADMLAPLQRMNMNVVLLSDGRPSAGPRDYQGIISEKLLKGDIKFSAIGCGKDVNEGLLKQLVATGKGSYYRIQDDKTVPQIRFEPKKDDLKSAELLVIELPLKAKVARLEPSLNAIPFAEAPPLLGYNRVRAKDLAEVSLLISAKDEPLLARWHFGAGRSAAWTTDLKGRWAANWIRGWGAGYGRALAQLVRCTMSRIDECRIDVQPRHDSIALSIRFQDLAPLGPGALRGAVIRRAASGAPEKTPFEVRRAGVDALTASIPPPAEPYLLKLESASGKPRACQGRTLLPARELHLGTANTGDLREIARAGGGTCLGLREYAASGRAFARTPAYGRIDLTPWLMLAAGCLFFLEIVVKRLVLPSSRPQPEARPHSISAAAAEGVSA